MSDRPKARFALGERGLNLVYSAQVQAEIAERVTLVGPPVSRDDVAKNPDLLADVEIIFSSWGGPWIDQAVLDASPQLKVLFYGAGSVRSVVSPEAWAWGLTVVTAATANAVPVVEFTVAQIYLAMKHVWRFNRQLRQGGWARDEGLPGGFGSRVGLVSLGLIGGGVADRMLASDMHVCAFDPYPDPAYRERGVHFMSLPELFATCDVVSLHTPLLPETRGMISEDLLRSMKPGATLINTARGAVIDEPALVRVFADRPDLQALLDVTDPEPPAQDSPLRTLPNVMLTPHVAGSVGTECLRMGKLMLDELDRYLAGKPLQCQLTAEEASRTA